MLENCASKLRPYLTQAVENSGNSFEDYSSVVASICQVAQNDAATDKPVVIISFASVIFHKFFLFEGNCILFSWVLYVFQLYIFADR